MPGVQTGALPQSVHQQGGGGNSTYLPPVIETIDIETEKGFATSPTPPDVYDDWGSGGGAGGIGSGSEHEL